MGNEIYDRRGNIRKMIYVIEEDTRGEVRRGDLEYERRKEPMKHMRREQ